MVDPEFRGMKLARRLYEARKQLVRDHNLKRIVIGGRIPGYVGYRDEMTAREYVERVCDRAIFDPVLTVQLANGFQLKRLIPDYLHDEDSAGYATLCEWVNLDFEPDPNRRLIPVKQARICVVQYQMREVKNFDEFAQQVEYFVDVGSGYKCDFILFPEIFTLQLLSFIDEKHPADAVRKLASFTPQYLELFSELAIKYNIHIIGGSHFTLEDDALYNIAYLFKRDGGIGKQPKLHITPSERHWWGVQPGDHIEVFDTDKGKIAISICYDIEFPEVARIACERGANMIFVPFCTDERYGYLRVRYCAQARAIENQIYVAIAGTVGNLPFVENMDIQYAQSGIFTPSDFPFPRDAIASECSPNIETVIIHDVDIELLRRHRRRGSVLNWRDRRLDLYELRLRK
jgi:predicted amidohydrolase